MTLRKVVSGVPLVLLTLTMVSSFVAKEDFLELISAANRWILVHFGWLYALAALSGLILLGLVYFSPIGRIRLGGPEARPILGKASWFSVALCTTIAVGILFWATAEPLYHFRNPPEGTGIREGSPEASTFAMSTLFLHWTFIPYSIYTLTALVFALSFYQLKQPFRIGSLLVPLVGAERAHQISPWVDSLSLFSLVAGMAASMGAGLLTLSGGIQLLFPDSSAAGNTGWMALALTLTFVGSAILGLRRGIRILSHLNIAGFALVVAWFLVFGPMGKVWQSLGGSLADFVLHLVPRSQAIGMERSWAEDWTLFYWANWLAWTPISALFLGKLGVGYDVRTFIRFNLVYPALFSLAWMFLFGGISLHTDTAQAGSLFQLLEAKGPESIVFALIGQLPLPALVGGAYFVLVFLSFVTAADSNTSAMSSLSMSESVAQTEEAAPWVKLAWGCLIGLTAWVMVRQSGIDGVRMASNLGGFPALFLFVGVIAGMIRMLFRGKH